MTTRVRVPLALVICLLGLEGGHADDLYWDINAATANTGTGATGNWNGTIANWNSDSTGGAGGSTTATTTAADNLSFSSGTGHTGSFTVTASGTRAANSLAFQEGTVTVSGGTIDFGSGASGISVASGRTATINSVVNGTNGLTKTGAGTLMLGTGNIFNAGLTGTISIKEGRLTAGSSVSSQNATNGQLISLGDTAGTAGATFSVNRNQNYNSDVIVNAGSSGVKRISGGPGLAVNQSPSILGAITLNDDVTLGNGSGGDIGGLNLAGVIAGSKTITVDGATQYTDAATLGSIAIIRGASDSSFSGNVVINRGILRVGSTGAIGTGTAVVSTAAGSALDLSTGGINGSSISIAGLNNGASTGGTVTNHASGTGTAVLSLAGSGSYSYGGTIADGATSKVGVTVNLGASGSQTLTGTCTYTGATTVSSGSLFLNGSLGAGTLTTVASAGTVGGTGVFNGALSMGGTLAPGVNAIGTLHVNGDLALDGAYAWEIGANSAAGGFDKLAIGGAANVTLGAASTLNIMALGGVDFSDGFWDSAQSWAIIDNAGSGSIGGSFASLSGTTGNSFGFFSVGYDSSAGGDVTLNWTPVPEPSAFALLGLGGVALLFRRRI